jgi:hypothetical protein
MVIYDTMVVQHGYRWLRRKFSRIQPDIEKNESKAIEEEEKADTTNAQINESKTPKTQVETATMNAKTNEPSTPTQAEPRAEDVEDVENAAIELCDLGLNDIIPYSLRTGWIVLGAFIVSLIVIMVLRGIIHDPLLKYFSNMYLAGTIICGGGYDPDLLF